MAAGETVENPEVDGDRHRIQPIRTCLTPHRAGAVDDQLIVPRRIDPRQRQRLLASRLSEFCVPNTHPNPPSMPVTNTEPTWGERCLVTVTSVANDRRLLDPRHTRQGALLCPQSNRLPVPRPRAHENGPARRRRTTRFRPQPTRSILGGRWRAAPPNASFGSGSRRRH